jgi:hypothetical protein
VSEQQHLTIPIEMGCYGIGVSRLIAAIVEAKHDNDGTLLYLLCGSLFSFPLWIKRERERERERYVPIFL